jgi:hypothetical protein
MAVIALRQLGSASLINHQDRHRRPRISYVWTSVLMGVSLRFCCGVCGLDFVFFDSNLYDADMTRPTTNEAAEYYWGYINQIQDDNIISVLKRQLEEMKEFLDGISDEKSLASYAPDKWSIRELINHVNDGERVFFYRAFWFARGFTDALPGFDQDICADAASANDVPWNKLKEEFAIVRLSTLSFFESLPAEAWSKTGVASDCTFTVNALAYIIAGHVAHHRNVLVERYL